MCGILSQCRGKCLRQGNRVFILREERERIDIALNHRGRQTVALFIKGNQISTHFRRVRRAAGQALRLNLSGIALRRRSGDFLLFLHAVKALDRGHRGLFKRRRQLFVGRVHRLHQREIVVIGLVARGQRHAVKPEQRLIHRHHRLIFLQRLVGRERQQNRRGGFVGRVDRAVRQGFR